MTDLRQAAQQEPVAYDKTEINCFVQDLYDQKMQEGKHGHYETMFHVVHQAIKKVAPPAAQPEQQAEPVAKLFGTLPVYDITSPQRKELFASEILNMMPSAIPAEYDGELMEFARAIEAKLKERNGY